MRPPRTPWYQTVPVIIVLLICCWPVGLVLMWGYAPWTLRTKGVVSAVVALVCLIGLVILAAPR
jgi:hypothetical protein